MKLSSYIMKTTYTLLLLVLPVTYFSCKENDQKNHLITVSNSLDIDRKFETVEVFKKDLSLKNTDSLELFSIKNTQTEEILTTQAVDNDDDGKADMLLFQPHIKANGEATFELVKATASTSQKNKDSVPDCYSRFVPERTDDYAWENNRVAFRTYGPKAQKMVEDSVAGGTLSSGMDAWLKRVEYPIINKWYKKDLSGAGSYHVDTGEGYDGFHVGASRGVGGTAVKVDSVYYTSKNFTSYKTITNGPLRTSFSLTYADWDANGNTITEKMLISLDYGSNLSRFEIHITGTDTLSAGITLHDQKGSVTTHPEKGYLSYWEPLDDSELGMGIVTTDETMQSFQHYITTKTDESNLYAQLKVSSGKTVYYAGFGWKKSGQFATKEDWNTYLDLFSKKINSPLTVVIK